MSRVIPDFAIVHAGEALFQEFLVLIVDPRVFRNEISVFFSRPDGSVIALGAYTGVPVTIIAVSVPPTPFSFPTLVEELFARRVFFLERPRPLLSVAFRHPSALGLDSRDEQPEQLVPQQRHEGAVLLQ